MSEYRQMKMNVSNSERWASLVGGGLALFFALTRPSATKLPLAAGGGYLLYRGLSGKDPVYEMLNIRRAPGDSNHLFVRRAVTINRPRAEVFAFWRNFENLPRFMEHLQAVQVRSDGRSHWVTRAPLGQTVEWDAEIVDERENEWIEWRSLPDAAIENAGRVEFRDALDGSGTEVDVRLEYQPPLGSASVAVARLFGEQPWQQVRDDLRRFKQIMEAGETPTIFAQSSGRLKEVAAQRAELRGEQREAQAAGALPPG